MTDRNSDAFRAARNTIHATFVANLLRHTSLDDDARKMIGEQVQEFALELITAYEAAKWQPIETAPNEIDILVRHKKGILVIGLIRDGWLNSEFSSVLLVENGFTHWQPLPKNPPV